MMIMFRLLFLRTTNRYYAVTVLVDWLDFSGLVDLNHTVSSLDEQFTELEIVVLVTLAVRLVTSLFLSLCD